MRLKEALDEFRPKVNEALNRIFNDKIIKARCYGEECVRFYENLREFVLRGGKRLRPIALIMAYHAIKKPERELDELVRASTCIELLHNSTLIHDDIIDQDTLRRGGPTFHIKYEQYFRRWCPTRANIYGMALGILGGDELFNMGFEVLLTSNFEPTRRLRALEYYVMGYREVVNGELLDLVMAISDYESLKLENYIDMVRLKTAALFEKALAIGAVLANASEEQLRYLREYGVRMAEAFQIQDDILGVYGEEKELGKPVGSDLREGKATILIIEAMKKLPRREKETLKGLLGRPDISKGDVELVRRMLQKYGILQEVRDKAKALVEEAVEALRKAHIRDEAYEFFVELAEFIIRRTH